MRNLLSAVLLLVLCKTAFGQESQILPAATARRTTKNNKLFHIREHIAKRGILPATVPGELIIKFAKNFYDEEVFKKHGWASIIETNLPKQLADLDIYQLRRPLEIPTSDIEFLENLKDTGLDRIFVISFEVAVNSSQQSQREDIINLLTKDKGMAEYAEPNNVYNVGESPTEPNDALYPEQTHLKRIGMQAVWKFGLGTNNPPTTKVRIVVMDSGIDYHADLDANVRTDLSRSLVNNEGPRTDKQGHGTHVAGIIGAVGNNAIGISGVLQRTEMASLQVIYTMDLGNGRQYFFVEEEAIIKGLLSLKSWEGPIVVNMSLGGPRRSEAVFEAIKALEGKALIVAAAGNESYADSVWYPCGFSSELTNVICVSGLDPSGGVWYGSNYSKKTSITALAKVLSTVPTNSWIYKTGTSMATPQVAAVSALVWLYAEKLGIKNPSLITPAMVSGIVIRSGRFNKSLVGLPFNPIELDAEKTMQTAVIELLPHILSLAMSSIKTSETAELKVKTVVALKEFKDIKILAKSDSGKNLEIKPEIEENILKFKINEAGNYKITLLINGLYMNGELDLSVHQTSIDRSSVLNNGRIGRVSSVRFGRFR